MSGSISRPYPASSTGGGRPTSLRQNTANLRPEPTEIASQNTMPPTFTCDFGSLVQAAALLYMHNANLNTIQNAIPNQIALQNLDALLQPFLNEVEQNRQKGEQLGEQRERARYLQQQNTALEHTFTERTATIERHERSLRQLEEQIGTLQRVLTLPGHDNPVTAKEISEFLGRMNTLRGMIDQDTIVPVTMSQLNNVLAKVTDLVIKVVGTTPGFGADETDCTNRT